MRISDWSSDVCSSDLLPCLPELYHVFHDAPGVADDGQIDANRLVDGRAIYVDVDLARVRRKGVQPAGHAIVEPRAQADDQVRLVPRPVRLIGTLHSKSEEPRVGKEVGRPRQYMGVPCY